MKKLLTIAALTISMVGAAQNVLYTKKVSTASGIIGWRYHFELYNDSIVCNLEGGFLSGKAAKRQVFYGKQKIQAVGEITQYSYRNASFDILVTKTRNTRRQSVKIRFKDDFSGQITQFLYY